MNYMSDMEGYLGDFGSNSTRKFFEEAAERHKLIHLSSFLSRGESIDLAAIIAEVRGVEWPKIDGMSEAAGNLVEALQKVRGGIVFIED